MSPQISRRSRGLLPHAATFPLFVMVKGSSDSGHRRAVVQPPLSQCIRISEIHESEEVLGGPDARENTPPRSWKRRVRSAVLHVLALWHHSFNILLAKTARGRHQMALIQGFMCGDAAPSGSCAS